jgi:hypothetical protein
MGARILPSTVVRAMREQTVGDNLIEDHPLPPPALDNARFIQRTAQILYRMLYNPGIQFCISGLDLYRRAVQIGVSMVDTGACTTGLQPQRQRKKKKKKRSTKNMKQNRN